ncbi:MAG: ATP-binding protein [Oscillospiraceae bacterium]|nr:ATP-binding protein [Oscillospiraceae bacterium]
MKITNQEIYKILDFMHTIEFFYQEKYLSENRIDKIKDKDRMLLLRSLPFTGFVSSILQSDEKEFVNYPLTTSVHVCIGRVAKEPLIKKMYKHLRLNDDRPEETSDELCLIGLKITQLGSYEPDSLRISPFVWCTSRYCHRLPITRNDYDNEMSELAKIISGKENICQADLDNFYNLVCKKYSINAVLDGYMAYYRYADGDALENNESKEDNFSELFSGFYEADLNLVKQRFPLASDAFRNYITSLLVSENGYTYRNQPDRDIRKDKALIKEWLSLEKAPLGKWPSKHSPSLMQQIAINIAISDETANQNPIFSVNGPPGTGKTTLLKEIIASNIVQRAILLAEYKEADDAFKPKGFIDGEYSSKDVDGKGYDKFIRKFNVFKNDAINDYGMIVASCNNAAVENITKELPDAKSLLDSIGEDNNKVSQNYCTLNDIRQVFDVSLTTDKIIYSGWVEKEKSYQLCRERDVFFSKLASNLLGDKAWGTISAPLGKGSNINNYCWHILRPLVENYLSIHDKSIVSERKEQYNKIRIEFNEQLNRVKRIRDVLLQTNIEMLEKGGVSVLNDEFWGKFDSNDIKESTSAQTMNPWTCKEYDREREYLFYLALQLQKAFVISSKCCYENLKNLGMLWKKIKNSNKDMVLFSDKDKKLSFADLLNTMFLVTPVISTTFASVSKFLQNIREPRQIGLLIVDEAGQAPPHAALGALFRCRRAIVVGDPKQVEPVVTDDLVLIKRILVNKITEPYMDKNASVQVCADLLNNYGSNIGDKWVGCPLVVHRRCINPMFDISNAISYDKTMKNATFGPKPEVEKLFVYPKSCWIDVDGKEKGEKNHHVENQAKEALKIIVKSFQKYDGFPDLYVISPFTTVVNGLCQCVLADSSLKCFQDDVKKWVENNCGTVHKFQGKEAKEVIFLLGCDSSASGAVNWVKPNILNVAATRAKFRFYIIGDYNVWQKSRIFEIAKKIMCIDGDFVNAKQTAKPIIIDISESAPAITRFSVKTSNFSEINSNIPKSWCSHIFTSQEFFNLNNGRWVYADDFLSKKTGNKFAARVEWSESEQRIVIVKS